MREALLKLLVDPSDQSPLVVRNGRLVGQSGRSFAIDDGIPRFVDAEENDQRQVERSFGYKWHQQDSYSSPGMVAESQAWLIARYGFESAEAMARYFSRRGRVLDAGCGGGWSASLWLGPAWTGPLWVGLDISRAIDVAKTRVGAFANTEFVQADVMAMPFARGTFDIVFSEGVLHHTPSTERAFASAASMVAPGGELMAYVYRKKGPVREFTDDHLRAQLSQLPPEEAWEKLRPLTRLAQSLAELRVTVDVPEAIDLLGIPAGTHEVQRLLYWHFAKMFWNDKFTFDENLHVNFDWYHPAYAHRQTAEDIERWCGDAGLTITRLDTQESGYTVRAERH